MVELAKRSGSIRTDVCHGDQHQSGVKVKGEHEGHKKTSAASNLHRLLVAVIVVVVIVVVVVAVVVDDTFICYFCSRC